jgi:hypothetical protein
VKYSHEIEAKPAQRNGTLDQTNRHAVVSSKPTTASRADLDTRSLLVMSWLGRPVHSHATGVKGAEYRAPGSLSHRHRLGGIVRAAGTPLRPTVVDTMQLLHYAVGPRVARSRLPNGCTLVQIAENVRTGTPWRQGSMTRPKSALDPASPLQSQSARLPALRVDPISQTPRRSAAAWHARPGGHHERALRDLGGGGAKWRSS